MTLLAREVATRKKVTFSPLGAKNFRGKGDLWMDITRKEVTENRGKGDLRGTGTRKEVTLHPEKRGFIPRDTKPSELPGER